MQALDDYRKSLYLRMLCSIILCENEPTEMQNLLLRHIVTGARQEESMDNLMRQAMEIDETKVLDSLEQSKGSSIKYYFTLDAVLLTALGEKSRDNLEYLASLIELLDVKQDEITCICVVAKSILMQASSIYDQAKQQRTNRLTSIHFIPYVANYYAGAIMDTDTQLCYSASNRKLSKEIAFPKKYTKRFVKFEDLETRYADVFLDFSCLPVKVACAMIYAINSRTFLPSICNKSVIKRDLA